VKIEVGGERTGPTDSQAAIDAKQFVRKWERERQNRCASGHLFYFRFTPAGQFSRSEGMTFEEKRNLFTYRQLCPNLF
jgi:hypothetical protein